MLACVGVVSSHVAMLPALVYRREGASRFEAPEHPLAALIRSGPNAHQSWPDFIEWLIASALLDGNALAEIVTGERGEVIALKPIPWRSVAVRQMPSGRLRYDFNEPAMGGAQGASRSLLEDEALHLRDRSDDGFVGVSRLRRAAGVAEGALMIDAHAKAQWRNADRPSGVLMHERNLSREAASRMKEQFTANYGDRNRGRPAVLEEGLKFQPFPTISPEDAEILAARRFTVEELARVFQVPPPMIGDLSHGTFTNSETMLRYFAQSALAFWVRKLEAAFARSVFAAGGAHEIDFDMSGLLRGDPATRWAAHKIAIDTGVLTPDEVREVEGWNPRQQPHG